MAVAWLALCVVVMGDLGGTTVGILYILNNFVILLFVLVPMVPRSQWLSQ